MMMWTLKMTMQEAENLIIFLRQIHGKSGFLSGLNSLYNQLNTTASLQDLYREFEDVYPEFCNRFKDSISENIDDLEHQLTIFRNNKKSSDLIPLGSLIECQINYEKLKGIVIDKDIKDDLICKVLHYNKSNKNYEILNIPSTCILKNHGLLKENDDV